jgi:hypothetical protein
MKNLVLAAILAAIASVGVLAACGGDSTPPASSPSNAMSADTAASAAPAAGSAAPASSAKK